MGIRASATRELVFTDCRVPAKNILGKEGMGFIVAVNTLNTSRPGVGSQALGIAAGALNEAVNYSRQRIQFGQPIAAIQAVQHMLANMATEIEASRALLYQAAKTIDAGAKGFAKISAMSKLYASEVESCHTLMVVFFRLLISLVTDFSCPSIRNPSSNIISPINDNSLK